VFAAFASVLIASIAVRARAAPFWHDEIYTILHAGLPSVGTMWAAGLDGFDLGPPLNTWLTRLVHDVAGVGPIATRVPAMAGYLVMTAMVFHMIRVRASTAAALAGALLPAFTAAYRYSYEARSYGLMLGLFALSLYAWSEAARDRQRRVHLPLLVIALAASLWNHYYAVLTFIPIAGGEAVRTIRRRAFDRGMLAAFGTAALLTLPLVPLAAVARAQSQSFWSPAAFADVGHVYDFLFPAMTDRPIVIGAIVFAVLMVAARRPRHARQPARTVPAHEAIAALLALAMPAIGVTLGVFLTGVFVPRYGMATIVGFALVIPMAVWASHTRWGIAELLLCLFLANVFGQGIGPSLVSPPVFRDPFLSRPLLVEAVAAGPVVSSSSLQFLQYWYYAPAAQRGRLSYLADPAEARKYMRSDTIDRGYLTLRRWTAVPIDPYTDYVAGHREFRVHEAGAGWLLRKLDEIGAAREEVANRAGERVYVVRLR
jgi:hypothetical protein